MNEQADKLTAILNTVPTAVRLTYASMDPQPKTEEDMDAPADIVVTLSFSEKGFGFGEVSLMADKDGRTIIDTEHMGKAKALKYLSRLIEEAIDDVDQDPERHALYNEIRGRKCGDGCRACFPEPGVQ